MHMKTKVDDFGNVYIQTTPNGPFRAMDPLRVMMARVANSLTKDKKETSSEDHLKI